jgi:catechol 2,3-dioxygenase-like lactoylglutathione lyase family enzyme
MAILRMDHVGLTVRDLPAATAFFVAIGFDIQGEMTVEGELVDRITALDGVVSDIAMLATPDGHNKLELCGFRAPEAEGGEPDALVHVAGLRHICLAVDDLDATLAAARAHGGELIGEVVDYGKSYKLCYLRGPEGVIVELAEALGG